MTIPDWVYDYEPLGRVAIVLGILILDLWIGEQISNWMELIR